MPTIKRKVEMTLSELIEYGFNNPKKIRGKIFKPQSFDSFWNPVDVRFSDDGCAVKVNGSVTDEDVYTVEIEETVTEDTVIPKMLTIYYDSAAHTQKNKNLNFLIKNNLKSAYIMNDDLTLTLIWTKEKGLIK